MTQLAACHDHTPRRASLSPEMASSLRAFDFHVTGVVQGVFFRKFTVAEATRLGLVGWVANAPDGSVVGHAQGPPRACAALQAWLRHTGSPASRVDAADFTKERDVPALEFSGFVVRR